VDPQPSFRNCWPRNAKTPFRPPSTPGDSSQPRPPPAARENTQNGNQDHRDREDRCALGARSARGDLPSTRTNARHMPSTLPNPTAVAMCRRSRDDDWSGRRAASTRRWSTYFAGVVPTSAVNTRAPGAPRRSHTPSRHIYPRGWLEVELVDCGWRIGAVPKTTVSMQTEALRNLGCLIASDGWRGGPDAHGAHAGVRSEAGLFVRRLCSAPSGSMT
jgi:hypothetical protein